MTSPPAGEISRPLLPVAHIPQRQHGDCLVACAAMVLAYLGRPISYNRLLRTLGVQPGVGAPFSNLRFLERLKVTVIYEQGTLAQLQRFLTNGWPCIVPVKSRELPYWANIDIDHAVVVVGMEAMSIYLNDPAFVTAPLQVPLGDFDLAWFERGEHYAVLLSTR
jgi:ABC-type bacteriocin/lantibiotic exporter with double-glycine peptidase domain